MWWLVKDLALMAIVVPLWWLLWTKWLPGIASKRRRR